MLRQFEIVDVFSAEGFLGNALAVVHAASDLTAGQMLLMTRWLNLSETAFLLPPSAAGADYRVRIFTPGGELPFAGHPTLGSCHAWLAAGNTPARADEITQECGAGLVPIRRTAAGLAFSAPPLLRSGPVNDDLIAEVAGELGIDLGGIVAARWADNGPGWIALLLDSADAVLALRPGLVSHKIGVAGPYPDGGPAAFEVRAFFPVDGQTREDPVTGSLNASLAQWLLGSGRASAPYVASQGTALGRAGRVHIGADPDGTVWVGGATATRVRGIADI